VVRTSDRVATSDMAWSGDHPDPATSSAPYRLYNIGNSEPNELMDLIGELETSLGRKAEKIMVPMQMGDVPATWADVDGLVRDVGFHPGTPLKEGIARFVEWYQEFYGVD